jgi:hypothetical protein
MELPKFALNEWIDRFAIDRLVTDKIRFDNGPSSVCFIEQIRAIARQNEGLGDSVPCDVFVLGLGEPDERATTKIGGLPYRPRNVPWPMSMESQKPLTFVAQFCFTDSRDLFPDLPGDMLLAFFEDFAAEPYTYFPGPPQFEWYSLGQDDLISVDEIPSTGFTFPICYGARYRTCDYGAAAAERAISRAIRTTFTHSVESPDVQGLQEFACVFPNLKIGGLPCWPGETPGIELEIGSDFRFLAAIPSIYVGSEEEYPWLNVEREPEALWPPLVWSEEGTVQLFLRDDMAIVPVIALEGWEP